MSKLSKDLQALVDTIPEMRHSGQWNDESMAFLTACVEQNKSPRRVLPIFCKRFFPISESCIYRKIEMIRADLEEA